MSRVGEIGYNNFGSKMEIINEYKEYDERFNRNHTFIDVYFPQYDWIFYHAKANNFDKGCIKCPYEPSVHSVGYLGVGRYPTHINGKSTRYYDIWKHMLRRCYDEKYIEKYPTYIDCEVCDKWLNFQNFAQWYEENYYEVEGQRMELDKDILCKGNKIYSPSTCIFVPQRINYLFIKSNSMRGNLPIGVTYHKRDMKFMSQCNIIKDGVNKKVHIGAFNTPKQAFESYKKFKENYIKEVAEEYKNLIPTKLYEAMYKYEVEITD